MNATPSSVEMLASLVGFDTTSRRSNLALIDFVRAFLDNQGVSYRLSANEAGDKANLHATLGPVGAGGVALCGHVDTVPVDGQTWASDPFTLHREGDRLHARGAADMKGFVACALAAVPRLRGMALARPLHLFLTYDEETTCAGARRLVADLAESGLRPDCCIVGEPSGMQPFSAHKGKLDVRVEVRGRAGHSAMPASGVNAVHAGAEAIARIVARARRRAVEGPFEDGFDPPHTTLHVGPFRGGEILNIIPDAAAFMMEWRTIPGDDAHADLNALGAEIAAEIEPGMHAVDPATGFTWTVVSDLPGLALDPDGELAGRIRQLTGANRCGKVSYVTEGGIFQQEGGIPTIICGPGHIAQAHRPDEYVTGEQLAACDDFLGRLAAQMLV
jgi:acetylornithine deacetylase